MSCSPRRSCAARAGVWCLLLLFAHIIPGLMPSIAVAAGRLEDQAPPAGECYTAQDLINCLQKARLSSEQGRPSAPFRLHSNGNPFLYENTDGEVYEIISKEAIELVVSLTRSGPEFNDDSLFPSIVADAMGQDPFGDSEDIFNFINFVFMIVLILGSAWLVRLGFAQSHGTREIAWRIDQLKKQVSDLGEARDDNDALTSGGKYGRSESVENEFEKMHRNIGAVKQSIEDASDAAAEHNIEARDVLRRLERLLDAASPYAGTASQAEGGMLQRVEQLETGIKDLQLVILKLTEELEAERSSNQRIQEMVSRIEASLSHQRRPSPHAEATRTGSTQASPARAGLREAPSRSEPDTAALRPELTEDERRAVEAFQRAIEELKRFGGSAPQSPQIQNRLRAAAESLCPDVSLILPSAMDQFDEEFHEEYTQRTAEDGIYDGSSDRISALVWPGLRRRAKVLVKAQVRR